MGLVGNPHIVGVDSSNALQMVGDSFSGSFEVVVVPLGGRVACLMKLIGHPLL